MPHGIIEKFLIDFSQATGGDHGAHGGLTDDDHGLYHTDARAVTWLATRELVDVGDVVVSGLVAGEFLEWDGDDWVNSAQPFDAVGLITVQDEGVELAERAAINFVGGGVVAADDDPYAALILSHDPDFHWPMDDASGGVQDATDNNVDGTEGGNPTYQITGPPVAGHPFGIAFDGSADRFFVGHDAAWRADATAIVWFKTAQPNDAIFTLNTGSSDKWWKVFTDASGFIQATIGSTYDLTDSTTPADDDEWHMMAWTMPVSGTCRLYLDGVEVGTVAYAAGTGSPQLQVGQDRTSGDFNGDAALATMIDSELSAAQILALYTARTAVTKVTVEGGLREIVTFTADGTFTKADYPWLARVKITAIGSGAGGGGTEATAGGEGASAAGGGGGGTAIQMVEVADLAADETVTVGEGGAGGVAGDNVGSAGEETSFGTDAVASGGTGGAGGSATSADTVDNAGVGGIGTTGSLLIKGGGGGTGAVVNGTRLGQGFGGDTTLGGVSRAHANSVGEVGAPYGGGGSGASASASNSARAGGDGADGIVIVELYG